MRHLHIENNSRGSALSHIKEQHVRTASERHADLLGGLKITIGWDGDVLDQVLPTAEFLIASRPPTKNLRQRAPKLR